MKNKLEKNLILLFSFAFICYTVIFYVAEVKAQVDFAPAAASGVSGSAQAAKTPVGPDVGTSTLLADPYGYDANKVYTGEKITLDFQNADIHNILRLIGEVSGKNVVVSDQVTGKVTLKLKNVPWDQALDIVLASKKLGVMENGNVLRIDSLDSIKSLSPDINDPNVRVPLIKKTFTPKYASVSALATELDKGKSMRGTVRVIGNDIYVEDDMATISAITQIFIRNDRVTKQILIEARIVEATAIFQQELGIRWGGRYDSKRNWSAHEENSIANNMAAGEYGPGETYGAIDIASAASLGFGFLNKAGTIALSAELNASESVGQTKIISAPRIMAANDQEVYIKQGTQIPYKSGSSASTSSNTEFKDAVMELRVTPHIEENGQIVTLDITLTKDSPGARLDGTSEPSIDTREARTKLMVKDGETVVIGGIITDNMGTGSSRVPGLHRMPLLGWLFQNRQINNDKTELLIFITANIIPINI